MKGFWKPGRLLRRAGLAAERHSQGQRGHGGSGGGGGAEAWSKEVLLPICGRE